MIKAPRTSHPGQGGGLPATMAQAQGRSCRTQCRRPPKPAPAGTACRRLPGHVPQSSAAAHRVMACARTTQRVHNRAYTRATPRTRRNRRPPTRPPVRAQREQRLREASFRGDLKAVRKMLAAGANINAKDPQARPCAPRLRRCMRYPVACPRVASSGSITRHSRANGLGHCLLVFGCEAIAG